MSWWGSKSATRGIALTAWPTTNVLARATVREAMRIYSPTGALNNSTTSHATGQGEAQSAHAGGARFDYMLEAIDTMKK